MKRPARASRRRHILLVEDEPGVQEAFALLLEAEGYRVTTANDGRHALERLSRNDKPDLVITDYMMPRLDGLQMIAELHADPAYKGIPTLLMSSALPPDVDPAELADAFLKKPVDLPRLVEVIELLIEDKRRA